MDDVSIEKRHRGTSTLISTVGRKLESQRRAILTRRGMKNTEYAVLVSLSHQGRTKTELATKIGVPRPHIGLIVKDLLEKELVAVTSGEEVVRNRVYALSAAGFRLQEELQKDMLAVDRQLFEDMSELELFQLENVLERVQHRIPYVVH